MSLTKISHTTTSNRPNSPRWLGKGSTLLWLCLFLSTFGADFQAFCTQFPACESLPLCREAMNTEPLCSGYYAFPAHMLSAHTRRLARPPSWVSRIPRFPMEFGFKCENSLPHNKSGISMPFSTSVFSCE